MINIKQLAASLVCVATFVVQAEETLNFRKPDITPVPANLTYEANVAVRIRQSHFEIACPDAAACAWVKRHADEWFGFKGEVRTCASDAAKDQGPEGYALSAKPGVIRIAANGLQGVRYAMYTLRQSAERMSGGFTLEDWWLPALEVTDSPALAFRGVHFIWLPEMTGTFIEHQIRIAAYYKFNYVVLEPWGVFRSTKYPQISTVANAPLTVAEARRLATLSRDLGVTLVPQFNLFGHAANARSRSGKHITLDFNPAYQPLFEPAGGWNWCLSNPATKQYLRDIVCELHEAFLNPPYFHIGCDEADEATCPRCRMVQPYGKLVGTHIKEISEMLNKRGARAMMWHDMLLAKDDPRWTGFYARSSKENAEALMSILPRDIVICDWYYGGNYGRKTDPGAYPTLEYFKKEGFMTLTSPWNDIKALRLQAKYVREHGFPGMLETIWHHYVGNRFSSMMKTASHSGWGHGEPVRGHWTDVFATHWRQVGWDMGITEYSETGFYDDQVSRKTELSK